MDFPTCVELTGQCLSRLWVSGGYPLPGNWNTLKYPIPLKRLPCQPGRGRWQLTDRGHSLTMMLPHKTCETDWKEIDNFYAQMTSHEFLDKSNFHDNNNVLIILLSFSILTSHGRNLKSQWHIAQGFAFLRNLCMKPKIIQGQEKDTWLLWR